MQYSIIYSTLNTEGKDWAKEVTSQSISGLAFSGDLGKSICCVNAYPNKGNLYYRVHCMETKKEEAKWLKEVKSKSGSSNNTNINLDDTDSYAGESSRPIDAFAIKSDAFQIAYRVHLKKENSWLSWVMQYNIDDSEFGYAGELGKEIDGIQIMPLPED